MLWGSSIVFTPSIHKLKDSDGENSQEDAFFEITKMFSNLFR
jgi:hypothetical protein